MQQKTDSKDKQQKSGSNDMCQKAKMEGGEKLDDMKPKSGAGCHDMGCHDMQHHDMHHEAQSDRADAQPHDVHDAQHHEMHHASGLGHDRQHHDMHHEAKPDTADKQPHEVHDMKHHQMHHQSGTGGGAVHDQQHHDMHHKAGNLGAHDQQHHDMHHQAESNAMQHQDATTDVLHPSSESKDTKKRDKEPVVEASFSVKQGDKTTVDKNFKMGGDKSEEHSNLSTESGSKRAEVSK